MSTIIPVGRPTIPITTTTTATIGSSAPHGEVCNNSSTIQSAAPKTTDPKEVCSQISAFFSNIIDTVKAASSKPLAYIEDKNADTFHKVGQELLFPFSTIFGRSFKVEDQTTINEIKEHSNAIRKVIVAFVSILILPLTLVAGVIGTCLLQFSSTHKNKYNLISPPPPTRAPRATDLVSNYSAQTLQDISDVLIRNVYYRGLVDHRIYPIQTEFRGDTVASTCYPSTPEELAAYQQKVPLIISSVRARLEDTLNRTIQIPQILETLQANHVELFPYTF